MPTRALSEFEKVSFAIISLVDKIEFKDLSILTSDPDSSHRPGFETLPFL